MTTLRYAAGEIVLNHYPSSNANVVVKDAPSSLGEFLCDLDADMSYWMRATIPVFWRLLRQGNYPQSALLEHLRFYVLQILPALGSALQSDPSASVWPSFMTDDHVPMELSWSWTSGSPDPVTRFAIEPVPRSGTPSRLASWERSLEVLAELKTYSNGVRRPGGRPHLILEDGLFHQLVQILRSKECSEQSDENPSTVFYGFDLTPDRIRTKVYFILPSSFRNSSEQMRIMDAISEVFPSKGWAPLRNYICKLKADDPDAVNFFMIAIDCAEPPESRLKVYVRYVVEDLKGLLTHLSLGGGIQVSRQFARGMENAWKLSFPDCDGSWHHNGRLPSFLEHHNGRIPPFLVYYDLYQCSATPGVKVYFPMRYIGSNDLEIAGIIQKWFLGEPGFQEAGRNFVAAAQELCHTRPLCSDVGMFSYFGIGAHGEDKMKAFVYINPQIRKYPIPSLEDVGILGLEKEVPTTGPLSRAVSPLKSEEMRCNASKYEFGVPV